MKKLSDDNNVAKLKVADILHSKPVMISLTALILAVIGLATVKIVSAVQQQAFEKELAADMAFEAPMPEYEHPLSEADLKFGRYYLNGDKNSYYFQVNEDNTIEFCCEDMYSVFEKWNPGKEDVIQSDIDYWSKPQPFEIRVEEYANWVMLECPKVFDENLQCYLSYAPTLVDVDTLQFGIEGDFIYLD